MDWLSRNLPYLLAGISVGGQYALIAIGYTMVYGILRLINFAHGDIFMVAGLMMVYLSASLPIYISIPLVILLTVLIGFTVGRVAYKPLRSAPRMSVMISAIGVSYLLQNLALYITGGLAQQYPSVPWISDQITVFGASTKRVTVITPFLTIILVVILVALIKNTKIGMAMRAASKDFETSAHGHPDQFSHQHDLHHRVLPGCDRKPSVFLQLYRRYADDRYDAGSEGFRGCRFRRDRFHSRSSHRCFHHRYL